MVEPGLSYSIKPLDLAVQKLLVTFEEFKLDMPQVMPQSEHIFPEVPSFFYRQLLKSRESTFFLAIRINSLLFVSKYLLRNGLKSASKARWKTNIF